MKITIIFKILFWILCFIIDTQISAEEILSFQQQNQSLSGKIDYLKNVLNLRLDNLESSNNNVNILLTSAKVNTDKNEIFKQESTSYKDSGERKLQFHSNKVFSARCSKCDVFSAGLPNDKSKGFHVAFAEADIIYGIPMSSPKLDENMSRISYFAL